MQRQKQIQIEPKSKQKYKKNMIYVGVSSQRVSNKLLCVVKAVVRFSWTNIENNNPNMNYIGNMIQI